MSVRVYVPTTSRALAELVREGRWTGPVRAHAVTEALRSEWPDAEEESYEFAVLLTAGEESWTLRAEGDRPRRHVVVAEVSAAEPVAGELTLVEIAGDVTWKRVASAHVDTEDWTSTPDFDEDLAWFATQEIPDLV